MPKFIIGPAPSDYTTIGAWATANASAVFNDDVELCLKAHTTADGRITIALGSATWNNGARLLIRAAKPSDDPSGTYGIATDQGHGGIVGAGPIIQSSFGGSWGILNFTQAIPTNIEVEDVSFSCMGTLDNFALRFTAAYGGLRVRRVFFLNGGAPLTSTTTPANGVLFDACVGVGMARSLGATGGSTAAVEARNCTLIGSGLSNTSAIFGIKAINCYASGWSEGANSYFNFRSLAAGSENNASSDNSTSGVSAGFRNIPASDIYTAPTAGGGWDFTQLETSPLIDAGSAVTSPSPDIFGTFRPQGSAIDIGAVEYVSGVGPVEVEPDDVSLTTAVTAPAASATVSASVQSIALGVAVGEPTASVTASASPADVWAGVFVSAATATTGAAVAPDSIAAGVRVSSPSAHAVASASPDDVYMGAFVSAPTASESGEVLPADISMGLGVSSPIVTASASVVPGSVRLSATISAPPSGTATSAQPGSVRVPVAVSSPWVSTGALSTPDDIGLSVFVSSPVVDTSGVASPSHVIARVKASAPHVSAIWHAQPVNVRAAVAVNSPATSTSVTVPDASRLHRACSRPLVYRVACRGDRIHVAGPRQRIHTIRRP